MVLSPRIFIPLLALLWLLTAIMMLAMGSGFWPDGAADWPIFNRVGLITTGIAALLLSCFLILRKAWTQPTAVLYNLWLAISLLFFLFLEWPFEGLMSLLPDSLSAYSSSSLIALILFVVAAPCLLFAYLLSQRDVWRHFASKAPSALNNLCQDCGATKNNKKYCPYCNTPPESYYILKPLELLGAEIVTLKFEIGHWQIAIGRGVAGDDAYLPDDQHYQSIGSHHANIKLEPKNKQLTISRTRLEYEIAVNGRPIEMAAPLKSGDIIKLSNVEFYFGTPDNLPVVAYLSSINNYQGMINERLIFHKLKDKITIGRNLDNDLVLPEELEGISRRHVIISYQYDENSFYIINKSSQKNSMQVNGNLVDYNKLFKLEPEEAYLTFDKYDFKFIPVLH